MVRVQTTKTDNLQIKSSSKTRNRIMNDYIFLNVDLMADSDPVLRLQMTEYSPDVTGWDVESLCSPTSPPEDKEYHVLVKQGA